MAIDTRGYRPCVRVIIFKDGKMMLGKKNFKGKIIRSVPGGGIEKGKTPEETCIEEALEEVGVKVDGVRYLGITHKYDIELPQPERRRIYRGVENSWFMAKWVYDDDELLGSQGDALKATYYYTLDEIKDILMKERSDEPEYRDIMISAFEKAYSIYLDRKKKGKKW